jgi:peroxiredoxin
LLVVGLVAACAAIAGCAWLCWQLLRQNGRILLRLEELEKRFEADGLDGKPKHSLAKSRIKRDGLNAGTLAPGFRLPRVDGQGDVSLADYRGRQVLVVFSSPACEPCNQLAPKLESFHRGRPEVELIMISKGEPSENRAKVKQHGLTFPVVLQQGWTISRSYAIFFTPAAYLIDPDGVIVHDVAVGVEPILNLLAGIPQLGNALLSSRA